jgi:hypothetical protein
MNCYGNSNGGKPQMDTDQHGWNGNGNCNGPSTDFTDESDSNCNGNSFVTADARR